MRPDLMIDINNYALHLSKSCEIKRHERPKTDIFLQHDLSYSKAALQADKVHHITNGSPRMQA